MARKYKLGVLRRTVNRLYTRRVANGKGHKRTYLLITVGRKSGRERTTPVTIVEVGGQRWLVAPYGPVGWVHNIRAAGTATLRRGEKSEAIAVSEASADEAAPVLAHYLKSIPVVRPYFDVSYDSPLSEIAAEAHRHPVFRIG